MEEFAELAEIADETRTMGQWAEGAAWKRRFAEGGCSKKDVPSSLSFSTRGSLLEYKKSGHK